MRYYPVFLDIRNRPVLVIGGGPIALEKIQNLLKAGARITVIAPDILPSIRRFNRRVTLIERSFRRWDLSTRYVLVFAATGESDLNQWVSAACRRRRIWCNTVDDPAYCHYIIPALVRRGPLTIAISTSGVSPLLAKRIKQQLTEWVGPEYTVLTRLMQAYRQQVKQRVAGFAGRLVFWSRFFDYDPVKVIKQEGRYPIEEGLKKALNCPAQQWVVTPSHPESRPKKRGFWW